MEVEKPKKVLSEKQLEHLEKMRKRKAIKKEVDKIVSAKQNEEIEKKIEIPENDRENKIEFKNQLDELTLKMNNIHEYIEQKKNKKKEPKHTEESEYSEYLNPMWETIFKK